MSNNAEQYTVKTPEEILQKHYVLDKGLNNPEYVINAMREYSSELIKENERLRGTIGVECVKQLIAAREQNAELLSALIEARRRIAVNSHEESMVELDSLIAKYSKFQPKKDESHDATIKAQ